MAINYPKRVARVPSSNSRGSSTAAFDQSLRDANGVLYDVQWCDVFRSRSFPRSVRLTTAAQAHLHRGRMSHKTANSHQAQYCMPDTGAL